MSGFPASGLYAITPCTANGSARLDRVEAALRGGVRILQYRDKSGEPRRRLTEARGLASLCRHYGALFIVNDDVDLAAAAGADGVHLGRDDGDLRQARARLGPQGIIGVSCYDRLERAQQAAENGADYVAFGRFFPSRSKPEAVAAPLSLLQAARECLALPIVAIGGINADNGAVLLEAGAGVLAVIDGVFGAADAAAAAQRFAPLFAP